MRKTLAKFTRKEPSLLLLMRGEEPYFKSVLHKGMQRHFSSLKYDLVDVNGGDGEEPILNILDEIAPFSSGKLVTIRNAEKIKDKKGWFAEYIAAPTSHTVVIFDADGDCTDKLDGPLRANAVVFDSDPLKPYGKEIDNWIQDEAALYGKSMSPDQAFKLKMNIGTDLFALHNSIKKVALHSDGKIISEDDLRAVVTKTSGAQIYELTNAFGERHLKKAFHYLESFYRVEDDPSLPVCSSLLNYVERLIRAKSLLKFGLDKKDVAQLLKMSPYMFDKFEPMLVKYTQTELIDAHAALCDMDIQLKGSALDKRVLIENFLTRFLDRE